MQNFVSSNLTLEVGAKVISKAEYNAWYQSQREQLQRAACDEIWQSTTSKESQRIRAQMQKEGVIFVEAQKPDYSKAPEPWEIESYESKPEMGGKVLFTIRKKRDAHSFTRLHLFQDELLKNYTGKTVDELIDRDLESTRSMWAIKADRMKASDAQRRTEQIVQESSDELGKAAAVVASFETASKSEQAEMLQSTATRTRFLAAKKALSAARSFK